MDIFLYWRWWIILNEVSNGTKNEPDSEPIYNKKFLKTKAKSYGDEATDFHDNEVPKKGFALIILV